MSRRAKPPTGFVEVDSRVAEILNRTNIVFNEKIDAQLRLVLGWRLAVDEISGCWVPLYRPGPRGYSVMNVFKQRIIIHRAMYQIANGPIPVGRQIDHLCRNRACCNPAHLEAVTVRENLLRGETLAARAARSTHCINGHPFSVANTLRIDGKRQCRLCANATSARWRARKSGRTGKAIDIRKRLSITEMMELETCFPMGKPRPIDSGNKEKNS